MDARAHERQRTPVHGLVTRSRARPAARLLVLLVATALVAGIAGGLLRLGIAPAAAPDWMGQSALHHGALMICAFFGTVIGIERAVAVRAAWAWSAPASSGLAGLALLLGGHAAGAWLLVLASLAFVAVNVLVLRRQRAAHTVLLLASAFVWLTGNLLFALGLASPAVLPWWFAFLLMTVAAERLEMTRLMRRRPGAQLSLCLVLAGMLLAAAFSGSWPHAGGAAHGAALVLLAAWLLAFDIARRTVFADGLPRYMAVCLLSGYAWLATGGLAWAAAALGAPTRDIALHALGLGFLVSMVMGHAPVILPAVARVKLVFGPVFYLPLAVLHLSLLGRFALGATDLAWRAHGGLANMLAIALFAITVAGAAMRWRRKYES
jgi:hypothetical protein